MYLLTNHPALEKGLLVKELIRCVLYLLCQAGLDITLDAMCLIVNDLHRRIVLFDGFEISYAEIIREGVGGVVIVGS